MIRTIFTKIINILSIAIIIVAAVILLSLVFTKSGETPSINGYSFMKVLTGSMEPEIKTESIVIVKRVDTSDIEIGDVISFYSRDEKFMGVPVTHRVIEIDNSGETPVFTTKGDINVLPDKEPVPSEDVIGKVVLSSYILGVLIKLVTNPLIFFPLVLIPILFIVIDNIRKTVKSAKEIEQEEEEAVKLILEEIKNKKLEEVNNKKEEEIKIKSKEKF